jgi:plasmid maintenance system antidote protein VapI
VGRVALVTMTDPARQVTAGSREHGTRACYAAGCTCARCARANADYAKQVRYRAHQRQILGISPWIDGDAVRAHLSMLAAAGIPPKRAADLAGVPDATIRRLLHGQPGEAPTGRMHRGIAVKILAVRPSHILAVGAGLVDGTGTRRRLQALVACGWSQNQLARRLGLKQQRMAPIMGSARVQAKIALKVRTLYDDLWDVPPPEHDQRSRIAASRSRNYAAARGWPLPAAWDDDAIDDPAAEPPADCRRRGRLSGAEIAAEALELMRRQGLSLRQAAERMKRSKSSVEQAIARAARAGAA